MKLRKQFKNRIVAVAMLAVVLICSVPVSYADVSNNPYQSYDLKVTSASNKYYYTLYKLNDSSISRRVSFYDADIARFCTAFISTSPWNYKCITLEYKGNHGVESTDSVLSSENANSILQNFEFKYNGVTYYVGYYSITCDPSTYVFSGNIGALYTFHSDPTKTWRPVDYITAYLTDSLDDLGCVEVTDGSSESSTDASTWKGSQDNPDIDEAIGYLVIKNTNVNQQSDLGTLKDGVLPLYFNFDWKDKTSTGFSLTKNKYARTFIQVEVESKFVVYSDVKHTKIKHKFDNYGERGWLSKNIDPSNKPITFDSGDINNALPLTCSEILTQVDKNKIYGSLGQAIFPIGYNFLIRYRIVCTDSLTVIPDTSSGWHAGPWASTTLSGDDINDTSSDKSDHEGYGDDKNKNGETDDINHTRTDYDDNQDAKDNINDKKNDKSSLDLDSAKEFINQVADVPKMIGDLFSFFPNWVKYTVELGFAFIFILIVYKLIRG